MEVLCQICDLRTFSHSLGLSLHFVSRGSPRFTLVQLYSFLMVWKHYTFNESYSVVMCNSLRPHRLYSPSNSPGQNTGVGSCSLLQGIFPTQGSNPGLPRCWPILYQLSRKGSPHFTYKWAVMDDQGLRLSSSSFLCLSRREKGKGTLSYTGGCHQSELRHSGCETIWKYKQARGAQSVGWDRMQVVNI